MPRGFPFAWIALAAACALVVALAWQNRGLREQNRWLAERAQDPCPGMYVPRIETAGVAGAPVRLGAPSGDAQVLFFFTVTCPYCKASAPAIVHMARTLETEFKGRAPLLGVCHCSAAQARAYAALHGFRFPVAATHARRARCRCCSRWTAPAARCTRREAPSIPRSRWSPYWPRYAARKRPRTRPSTKESRY